MVIFFFLRRHEFYIIELGACANGIVKNIDIDRNPFISGNINSDAQINYYVYVLNAAR